MKRVFVMLFMLFTGRFAPAQELFPVADLASSVPKAALALRLFGEGYPEAGLYRNVSGLKLLYGLTPKLSVYATATMSDYHQETLPFDFISHNHSGRSLDSTKTPQQGVPYPMIFNSVDLYAKYRLVTMDATNTHFRVAVYAEGSYVAVPSHEAEPDLLIHTSGFGAGFIATYLKKHFAASFTGGAIVPQEYKGNTHDNYGGIYPTTIKYGNGINYDLSLGYLLIPREYTSYRQTNWNIYCEFLGKSYEAAKVTEQDGPFPGALVYNIPITTPLLKGGNFVDVAPGIQCILASSYRIDFSVELPLVNRSYDHLYPLCLLGVQRYFFFHKHSSHEKD